MKAWNWLKKPENIFAVVAGLFGLIAVFLIPPGWNSDEYQHFFRVEQLTGGKLFAVNDEGLRGGASGGYINRGVVEFMGKYGFENPESRENAPSPATIWSHRDMRTEKSDMVYVSFNGSAVYPPITYAPQIIGNGIGRVLGLPIYGSFLLAKIFGLIFFIGTVYIAIRIIPRGKWIVMAISILATTIIQSAALGADAVTFSAVVLFISYVTMLYYQKKRISNAQLAVMGLLMAAVGLVKPTYAALLPLAGIVLLNKDNRNRKTIVKLVVIGFISVVLALLWIKLTSYVGTNGGADSDKSLQLQHILSSPLEFLLTIGRTYFGVVPGGFWDKFYDVAFTNFVWDTVHIASGFAFLSFFGVVASMGIADSIKGSDVSVGQDRAVKLIMAGSFILTFLLINTALYLYFTPVGQNVVVGVQARYLFPFLVLLLVPLQNVYRNQKKAKVLMLIALVTPLLASIVGIYKSIYGA